MTWLEIIKILISGGIGFLFGFLTTLVKSAIDRNGKLKIYYKIYSSENPAEEFAFSFNRPKVAFVVPMSFEIQNTSNSSRVIRDLSINLFNKGKNFKKMQQVAKTIYKQLTNGTVDFQNTQEFGTHNNSYSFVIPARSIQNERCVYMYVIDQVETKENQFDEIKLSYYDENDKRHSFSIRKISKCWEQSKDLIVDNDWVLATK